MRGVSVHDIHPQVADNTGGVFDGMPSQPPGYGTNLHNAGKQRMETEDSGLGFAVK